MLYLKNTGRIFGWPTVGMLLLLCFFGSSTNLRAQYLGGAGDGFSQRVIVQVTFDGIPAGVTALYVGGSGDGFDQDTYSTTISGADLSALFSGGAGDGFDRESANFNLSGADLSILFFGGSGDGFDRDVVTRVLSGDNVNQLFGGGSGDGFDRAVVQLTLSGTALAELYGGGPGDGFDRSVANLTLNGQQLAELFGGGPGDGFDTRRISVAISGEDFAALYGGGGGDGFDAVFFAGSIPLPLTLISFDAIAGKDFVLLKWVTENEMATDFFTIEKTRDGLRFDPVGDTDAAGQSEPGERLHYEMQDDEPYQGTSFYRLKTTDFDGFISLSYLVEVAFSDADGWGFTLFPNPNTGQHFSIRTEGLEAGELLHLEVFDASGRALFSEQYRQAPNEAFRFDLAARLATGTYLVRLRNTEGGSQAKLLLVGR